MLAYVLQQILCSISSVNTKTCNECKVRCQKTAMNYSLPAENMLDRTRHCWPEYASIRVPEQAENKPVHKCSYRERSKLTSDPFDDTIEF